MAAQAQAAVDHDVLSGDIAALLSCEKQDGIDDVAGALLLTKFGECTETAI